MVRVVSIRNAYFLQIKLCCKRCKFRFCTISGLKTNSTYPHIHNIRIRFNCNYLQLFARIYLNVAVRSARRRYIREVARHVIALNALY